MTSEVEIRAVKSRWDRRQFLQLPWSIYRDDPHWTPPLRSNQKALAGFAHHPFYQDASRQAFLALQGGRAIGRVLAIVNPNHNQRHDDRCGFFGFFESIDDQRAASGLLGAAADWLASRGMTTMRGPVNPSMNYECALLVDGFDSPATFMLTYNAPYYAQLLENFGLVKSQDLYAYWEHRSFLEKLDPKVNDIALAAQERFNFTIRRFDKSNYAREVATLLDLFNRGTVGSWGFVPLTAAEAKHLGKELRFLLEPDYVRIAECEGKPIGVMMGLLDYNPIIKRIDGRLFPLGFLQLWLRRKRLSRLRILSANVLPEFQRWGVGLALIASMKQSALDRGIEVCEFSWVLQSNELSWKTLERAGLKAGKTYRLYDFEIDTARPGGRSSN